jgi:hypothetical protein
LAPARKRATLNLPNAGCQVMSRGAAFIPLSLTLSVAFGVHAFAQPTADSSRVRASAQADLNVLARYLEQFKA